MSTHPLWRPYQPLGENEIREARLEPDDVRLWRQRVAVSVPDPRWAVVFSRISAAITSALGRSVISLEHVGSTSVPGLSAKPVIDIDLIVADSSDEQSYVPHLEAKGFDLRIREPEWEQHRMLIGRSVDTNVHVFSPDAIEPLRHVAFRDWLMSHPEDRAGYERLKLDLAASGFDDVMLYNNAKAGLIYDIYERIFAADPRYPHQPQPRST